MFFAAALVALLMTPIHRTAHKNARQNLIQTIDRQVQRGLEETAKEATPVMYTLKSLETRWANAENPRGEKSRGGLAGNGRKGAPCVQDFKPHTTLTLLDQQARAFFGDEFRSYPAAGVKDGKSCYFDRSDDFCSVAYWYQALPAAPFAPLPSHEEMMADLNLEHEAGKTRRGDQ